MTVYQSNTLFLRCSLLLNATFSLACALGLTIFPIDMVALFFGDKQMLGDFSLDFLLQALAVGLVGFAGLLTFVALHAPISKALGRSITIADFGWVVSSAAIVFLHAGFLTSVGVTIVIVVATYVLAFAVMQLIGLIVLYEGQSRVEIQRDGRVRRVRVTREVTATPAAAWRVMTDHEAYVDVADNLSAVQIVEGNSKGMQRKCFDTDGNSWLETAHIWEDGKRYGFKIHTDADDYPYPLDNLEAVWAVEEIGPNRSRVSISFDVTPSKSMKGEMFTKVSMIMFPKLLDRLLGRWGQKMEIGSRLPV